MLIFKLVPKLYGGVIAMDSEPLSDWTVLGLCQGIWPEESNICQALWIPKTSTSCENAMIVDNYFAVIHITTSPITVDILYQKVKITTFERY